MFENWKNKSKMKKLGILLQASRFEPMCYEIFVKGKKTKLYVRQHGFNQWYCHKKIKNNPFVTYPTPEEAVLNYFNFLIE